MSKKKGRTVLFIAYTYKSMGTRNNPTIRRSEMKQGTSENFYKTKQEAIQNISTKHTDNRKETN